MWPPLTASAALLIPTMLNVWPAAKNVTMTPIIRPMSPVRVVRKAFIAALRFGLLLPPVADEHERAEADELPADEQLRAVFEATTSVSIDAVKRLSAA